MELDQLDLLGAKAFEGYIVRKDLVRAFSKQFPVPTYVVEFLLGKYCATVDAREIEEGLGVVRRQLEQRAVRAGEEELFKAKAREEGTVRLIDQVSARLSEKNDCYLATIPSLRLSNVRIEDQLVRKNDRLLTGGYYAEIELEYNAAIAQEKDGFPFGIANMREIQLSSRNVLETLVRGRELFTTAEWKDFLLRSIGFKPEALSARAKDVLFLRMVPFVERNYNAVELGPRGTGKSHLFQQVSPYARLISGGKTSVPKLFVNLGTGERGLVCHFDVVCFDEISGISFDQKDGVNIMKGYMESGEFSRGGKATIRADGSIVMVGNFDVDVEHQQKISHLLGPMPKEMRDDTAFMDRIHSYIPGWDFPKLQPQEHLTDHFGLVSDFLSECFSQLRRQSRVGVLQGRATFGGALSGRDSGAVHKTVSGLLKLICPNADAPVLDEDLEWAIRLSLECRRRVKEQQKRIGPAEFRNTHFSYTLGQDGVEKFVTTPELHSENTVGSDPLPPGQVWALSPGSPDEHPGLYRIEVNEGPGSGVRILNQPKPAPFAEAVKYAEQNLYARAKELVGDRDPRSHEFSVQLRSYDASRSGSGLSVAVAVAMSSALLKRNIKGGLIIAGSMSLGGSMEPIHNAVALAEHAVEKGAANLLLPVQCRKQLYDLSDEMATKIDVVFYSDVRDALLKAITE